MRDTDGDGMPDYKEVHYTDYYPFIVSWANNQHRQKPEYIAMSWKSWLVGAKIEGVD